MGMSSRHPWASCFYSQCLCDIFILRSHRLLKLSMPTPELLISNTTLPAQMSFPVFPIPVNGITILLARDLQMSLVLLVYPLCRLDQCILWSVLFFLAPSASALIQPTNTYHLVSFLLHSCHLVIHCPHNCQSDVCILDHVISPIPQFCVQLLEQPLSIPPVSSCAVHSSLCLSTLPSLCSWNISTFCYLRAFEYHLPRIS